MKFYEFRGDYEYYALIGVVESEKYPMATAINAYAEEIEGGIKEYNENYEDSTPEEITEQQALEEYKKATIEECTTEKEKVKDFYKNIKLNNEFKYVLLLVDGSLM